MFEPVQTVGCTMKTPTDQPVSGNDDPRWNIAYALSISSLGMNLKSLREPLAAALERTLACRIAMPGTLCTLLALCGLVLSGFTSAAHAASGRIAIESGGTTRYALLVEHARLKKTRRPVVIVFHGGGGGPKRVRHFIGLEERARSANPVLVYPEARESHWNDAATPGANHDTAFIHDLIAQLINQGIADRHRIFLVGSASGGMMALKLACDSADQFAGVAVLLASMPADIAASCKPVRPLPFLLLVGTVDPFVPYNGGAADLVDIKANLLSANDTLKLFAKAAACADGHTTTAFADHDARDNSRAFLDKMNGCKVPVELLRVEGGGHQIPRMGFLGSSARAPEGERGAAPPGMRNRDVDAPALIWDFLRRLGA
jgi:polyhydroxybutyrate depolymerase